MDDPLRGKDGERVEKHDHDQGLGHDLRVWKAVLGRRQLLQWAAYGAGLIACGGGSSELDGDGVGTQPSAANGDGSCSATIPEETAGPYPGDGTNGANALALDGIVRSDIRTSLAGASGEAQGVLLRVRLTIRDASCTPLEGYAVYIWHCDREGRYSMYSAGAENENYLRGVQETDADGVVEFTTIFPACYPGRWPHIHFEVYSGLAAATSGRNAVATSQLALPKANCDDVFETTGYEASINSLAAISLATDNVFRDGATLETPAVTGTVAAGYVASLDVTITP
jgi:protocatechuate 3,4-dioxygenase beta subunit